MRVIVVPHLTASLWGLVLALRVKSWSTTIFCGHVAFALALRLAVLLEDVASFPLLHSLLMFG